MALRAVVQTGKFAVSLAELAGGHEQFRFLAPKDSRQSREDERQENRAGAVPAPSCLDHLGMFVFHDPAGGTAHPPPLYHLDRKGPKRRGRRERMRTANSLGIILRNLVD
jgi:hypothetical protein